MFGNIRLLLPYVTYLLRSSHRGGHGIHSPFLYNVVTEVIENTQNYYACRDIRTLRFNLAGTVTRVNCQPLGATSVTGAQTTRTVGNIIRYSTTIPRYGELLFRLVLHFRPRRILELGTSLGIGTLYLAKPSSGNIVYTIEGCEALHDIARQHFVQMQANNIKMYNENFDTALPQVLQTMQQVDFAFIDGNHRYTSTISYLEQILAHSHNDTVLVFDDIHWSPDMEKAWAYIQQHPQVRQTVDIFQMGIVFLRRELSKENFILRF